MATSPTVLVDPSSTAAPIATTQPPAASVKFPVLPLVIAVFAGVIATAGCIGGVAYYLVRSGRLPMHGETVHANAPLSQSPSHVMVLEPMLVNLADPGQSSYLRLALTLRVADPADKKDEKERGDKNDADAAAAVRDTALAVLGRQTADGLLAEDGKDRLKAELKAELAKLNPEIKVTDVFFTDYLVQR